MKPLNISYSSKGIARWLDGYRDKWEDFYPSERWAFDMIGSNHKKTFGRVLDVGCGRAGLGLAISSRYALDEYHGVDINAYNIACAEKNRPRFRVPVTLKCGDMLKVQGLIKGSYDTVISLSCVDWNIESDSMIDKCWQFVKPGGFFVMSFRLTTGKGINNIKKSYQIIETGQNGKPAEVANYVVFNAREFFQMIEAFKPRPCNVYGYGYWGAPAATAVTPYKNLVFGMVIVQKADGNEKKGKIAAQLNFPLDFINGF